MNLLFILLLSFNQSNYSIETATVFSEDLPNKISSLPIGIVVKHNHRKVYAEIDSITPERGGRIKWKYKTTVSSIKDSLKIIEFGACVFTDGKWIEQTIYDRPFNNQEFADWYNCPDGVLIDKEKYSDNNNWTSSSEIGLVSSKSLWYYIGEDKNKKKYVGYSSIITLANLKE